MGIHRKEPRRDRSVARGIGIHHVGISVHNLERSVAFYTAHFRFQVRRRGRVDGEALAFLAPGGDADGGVQLELVAAESSLADPADAPCVGARPVHLALAVPDLDEELARLQAAGVPVLWGPQAVLNGMRTAFVAGPDGEEIELLEV